jgi:hypothetical protein
MQGKKLVEAKGPELLVKVLSSKIDSRLATEE